MIEILTVSIDKAREKSFLMWNKCEENVKNLSEQESHRIISTEKKKLFQQQKNKIRKKEEIYFSIYILYYILTKCRKQWSKRDAHLIIRFYEYILYIV